MRPNDTNRNLRSGDFAGRYRERRIDLVANVRKDHRILAPIIRTFAGGDLPSIGFNSPALMAASLASRGVGPQATMCVRSWFQAIPLAGIFLGHRWMIAGCWRHFSASEFIILSNMFDTKGMQYSIASLLWLVAAIAVPLGLSMSWTPFSSLLLCSGVALILWCWTRKRTAGICLLAYVALLPLAFIGTIMVINPNHPYVRRYNERLERISMESRLVGDSRGTNQNCVRESDIY